MSTYKIETWHQREFASKILTNLETHGPTYRKELRRLGQFNNTMLNEALQTLVASKYVLREERRVVKKTKKGIKNFPRTYYSVTSESLARWEAHRKALEEQDEREIERLKRLERKAIERLKTDYPYASEEQLTEFYDDLKSALDDWFETITRSRPDMGGFSTDLEVHSEDYDGSIAIEWNLTSRGKEKLLPMKKLRPVRIVFKKKPGPKK